MRHSYNLFVAKLTFFFNFIKSYIKYLFFSDWGPSGPSRANKGGQRPSGAVGGRRGPSRGRRGPSRGRRGRWGHRGAVGGRWPQGNFSPAGIVHV